MASFSIDIVETLNRVVEVEAASLEEAFDQVEKMYFNEDEVLDSGDYAGTELVNLNGTESREI